MVVLSERFADALAWDSPPASKAVPAAQEPVPTPYVAHLLAVAAVVLEHGGGEKDEADCPRLYCTTRSKIKAATPRGSKSPCGLARRVAAMVEGATETDVDPKPPWRGAARRPHLERLRRGRSFRAVDRRRRQVAQRRLADRRPRPVGSGDLVALPRRQGRDAVVLSGIAGRAAGRAAGTARAGRGRDCPPGRTGRRGGLELVSRPTQRRGQSQFASRTPQTWDSPRGH